MPTEYDYNFANFGDKNEFRYIDGTKDHLEKKATSYYKIAEEEKHGAKAASKMTSLASIVKEYSTFTTEKKEEV